MKHEKKRMNHADGRKPEKDADGWKPEKEMIQSLDLPEILEKA